MAKLIGINKLNWSINAFDLTLQTFATTNVKCK